MSESDVFVYLDDVKYSKNSFHNRNQIKTAQGAVYLTVPVRYTGHSGSTIEDIRIDNTGRWATKHWRTIVQNYARTAFFDDLAPRLEKVYCREWTCLGDLNITLAELLRAYLGIQTPCYRSSELRVGGQANEKLVNLCRALGADTFVVKPGTEHYHPKEYFEAHGIGLRYFTPGSKSYPQEHGSFIPGLSALDFALNCGPGSLYAHALS